MKKILFYSITILVVLASCSKKEVKQGSIAYTIEYQLPDSLNRYLMYLPKSAMVYFKGDSAVSVQQMNDESTTIVTDKATHFMRALLRSSTKKYVIDYDTVEQAKEANARLSYTYEVSKESKTIAGYKALKYTLTNKATLEQSEVWFTKDISVIPNSLTMAFDTIHGFPVAFTTNQGGMMIKHTVKQVKFEPVPAGVFSTPAGYEQLTPEQLRNMPVEN